MDRLDAMTAFVTVAELRGFAPAARRLGLSPPAVTRLVAGLEARLSIRLLQRTTRSVALTDAGARFLERARRILGDVAEAEAAARAHKSAPAGRLVVAAPTVFGRREVAPLLCEFLTRYPAVTGELTLADRVVHLIDEGVDVAVRIGHLDDSSLTVRKVGETRRVLVAAPSYLAGRTRVRAPADLADHAHIQFTGLQATREWRFVRRGRELRVPLRPAFVTNSADAAIGHAELGGGVAMVLSYQVVDALAAGRLQVVLPSFEPPPLPIQVVYPSARLLSAAVRGFVDLTVARRTWRFV
ncbi:MAG: LysR family transcriptional regulator [Myxococcales bacterium]|nr:LysR family transcriptional regulator [Myxococcales bacterium]